MVNNQQLQFTKMEKLVIEQLKRGYSNKKIGEILNFSAYAIKYHVAKIIRKTGAVNRINAIYILTKNGYFKNSEQEQMQVSALR